jgi:hypothetical protein
VVSNKLSALSALLLAYVSVCGQATTQPAQLTAKPTTAPAAISLTDSHGLDESGPYSMNNVAKRRASELHDLAQQISQAVRQHSDTAPLWERRSELESMTFEQYADVLRNRDAAATAASAAAATANQAAVADDDKASAARAPTPPQGRQAWEDRNVADGARYEAERRARDLALRKMAKRREMEFTLGQLQEAQQSADLYRFARTPGERATLEQRRQEIEKIRLKLDQLQVDYDRIE